jgi:hypothetical protein
MNVFPDVQVLALRIVGFAMSRHSVSASLTVFVCLGALRKEAGDSIAFLFPIVQQRNIEFSNVMLAMILVINNEGRMNEQHDLCHPHFRNAQRVLQS